jgi:hypothetical protein
MATLTLRIPKGSPLTNAEIDDNFIQLDQTKIQLGGDIGGSTSSPTVISLRGRTLSSAVPTTGQAIVWNGSAWIPQTVSVGGGSGVASTVTILNDISNRLNGRTRNFTLKNGASAITESIDYVDNKDFLVIVGGRVLTPYLPQEQLHPWIPLTFLDLGKVTYRVSGSTLKLTTPPRGRQTAQIRINNISASRQQLYRYPFTASTIVFGE